MWPNGHQPSCGIKEVRNIINGEIARFPVVLCFYLSIFGIFCKCNPIDHRKAGREFGTKEHENSNRWQRKKNQIICLTYRVENATR